MSRKTIIPQQSLRRHTLRKIVKPINPNVGYDPGDLGYVPTFIFSKSPGIIESAPIINSSVWRKVAAAAWAYFQPGVGIEGNTGLPYSGGKDFKAFTDWDLGVYIQAVIDAQNLSLISSSDAYSRLDKVLTFLENRPLNTTTNYPFWFYDAENGTGYQTTTIYASNGLDVVDTGRLFVALNNLKAYNTSWTQRVDNFVYNVNGNRTDYAALVPSLMNIASSNSIYAYYFDERFCKFLASTTRHRFRLK